MEHNLFADLADAWPRAWACLGAVARAYGAGGGRWPYRVPAAPVPELPAAEVEAPAAETGDDAFVLSGIDPRFDQEIVRRMRAAAESGDAGWLAPSLSRISRHLGKLMQAVEYLLAHDVPILTANYLLRPREVWVRRGELVTVDHENPLAAWRTSRGLSGAHRAMVAGVVERADAKEKAAKDPKPDRSADGKNLWPLRPKRPCLQYADWTGTALRSCRDRLSGRPAGGDHAETFGQQGNRAGRGYFGSGTVWPVIEGVLREIPAVAVPVRH